MLSVLGLVGVVAILPLESFASDIRPAKDLVLVMVVVVVVGEGVEGGDGVVRPAIPADSAVFVISARYCLALHLLPLAEPVVVGVAASDRGVDACRGVGVVERICCARSGPFPPAQGPPSKLSQALLQWD